MEHEACCCCCCCCCYWTLPHGVPCLPTLFTRSGRLAPSGRVGLPEGRWFQGVQVSGHRFSAFWLRSSVVSVLISLISDMSPIWRLHIKWIFRPGSRKRSLLRPLHASAWYCSTSRNGAVFETVQKQKSINKSISRRSSQVSRDGCQSERGF